MNLRSIFDLLFKFLPSKFFPFISYFLFMFFILGELSPAQFSNYYLILSIYTLNYLIFFSANTQILIRYGFPFIIMGKKWMIEKFVISLTFTIIALHFSLKMLEINTKYFYFGILYIISYFLLEMMITSFRVVENIKLFNFFTALKSLIPILPCYCIHKFGGLNVENIFITIIICNLLLVTLILIFNYRKSHIISTSFSRKKYFDFFISISLTSVAIFLNSKFIIYFSPYHIDEKELGKFFFNYDFFEKILQNITTIFNISLTTPALKLFNDKNKIAFKSFVLKSMKLFIFISITILFFLFLFYNTYFSLFGKLKFKIQPHFLIHIFLSLFFIGLVNRFSITYLATNNHRLLLFITLISMSISIIVSIVVLPLYKLNGLYFCVFFSAFFWYLLILFFYRIKIKNIISTN